MTLSSRIRIAVLAAAAAAAVVIGPAWIGYQSARGEADYVLHVDDAPARVLLAQADTGSAAGAPAAEAPAPAPAPTPAAEPAAAAPAPASSTSEPADLPDAPDPGTVIKLWKSGAFLAAGALTLFLLLTLALKLDSKRAFYYTAGLTGLAGLVDMVAAGHQLTWSAAIVAVTTIVSIVVRGPQLKKEPGAG